jgi:hypothetical protein
MMVPMPTAIVLIVCKTVVAGAPDANAAYTGWEDRVWATEHSMMVCRREEVSLYDPDVDRGAAPQAFTPTACWRTAMQLGPQFDAAHKNSSWRFWRAACPVPIMRKNPDGTEDIIAWKMPDCGHRETVVCDVDTAI